MALAFLKDMPPELRDEIYDVYIRKGQLPGALYHDTCIVMRGDAETFYSGAEEYEDLITIDFKIRLVGNQISREFTSRIAHFVPLHLQGFFQKGEKSFRIEKESLERILPVQIVETENGEKEECTELSKGILIEADYYLESEEPEPNYEFDYSDNDNGSDVGQQPSEWYDGPPTNVPINDPSSEYWDEIARRWSAGPTSDADGDGDETTGSGDIATSTTPGWAGRIPVFDGFSFSKHRTTVQTTQPPEVWPVSTEGVEEFCRRLTLLEKTQDIVIRFDTQPADWLRSTQAASRTEACQNVRQAIVASVERIPKLKRYCVQVGDLAVFGSRKSGGTFATLEDYRITSETTEDWRSDAQYRKLLNDLRICW
ncbi:hypothetical protein BST61_g3327 [Cercospora zeina]